MATLSCGPAQQVDRWTAVPVLGGESTEGDPGPARDGGPLPGGGPTDPASVQPDASADRLDLGGFQGRDLVGGGGGDVGPVETDGRSASPLDGRSPDSPAAQGADGGRVVPGMADAPVETVERGCPPGTCRRVFITSRATTNGGLGSLAAADAACQRLADTASLGGAWRAWLSDASGSPATRFARSELVYRLLDGAQVARNWAGLTDGTLAHAIDVFETGGRVPAGQSFEVWTGTNPSGFASGVNCGNWTNNSSGLPDGQVGLSSRTDRGWTQALAQFCSRAGAHLYCFEQ
jgi:hypothetical protein